MQMEIEKKAFTSELCQLCKSHSLNEDLPSKKIILIPIAIGTKKTNPKKNLSKNIFNFFTKWHFEKFINRMEVTKSYGN